MRLLTDRQGDFLNENLGVLRAGLRRGAWITVDDTGVRQAGNNSFCTQIGNDRFTWFATGPARAGWIYLICFALDTPAR